jgi:hypothetical protein
MGFALVLLGLCLTSATANDASACTDDVCQWETGVQASSLLQARGATTKMNASALMDLYTSGDEGSALKNKHDRKCVDHNYGNDDVYIFTCHGGLNQQWYLTALGQLKNKYGDKCLDYNYGNGDIYMYRCHGGKNQQWYIDDNDRLVSKYDDKCVDYWYGDGEKQGDLYMNDCHGGKNQQFYFDSPTHARSLKTTFDQNCMDHSYADESQNVYAYPCHGGTNQKWYFTADDQLKNKHDGGKCLDYCLDGACGKGNVYMNNCHQGNNQKWSFDASDRIVSKYDGSCLDYQFVTKNYYVHACHGGKNQQFYFEDTVTAVKLGKLYPTFTIPVKCDMRCIHFATEKSDTSLLSENDQTMCPKTWMVMATPFEHRWATWYDKNSACDIESYDDECPTEEEVAEAGRVTDAHAIFDDPASHCDTDCWTCPTFDELVRLPDPHSEDDPDCSSGCEVDGCNDFVPCCVKRKEIPCKVKPTYTPKNVYSLAEGVGLHRLVDLMKSAMIEAPPHSAFLAGWLGELKPILGDATVLDLSWPGTHDTGTYDLSDIVSKHPFATSDISDTGTEWWDEFATGVVGYATNVMPEAVRLMGQAQGIDIIDQMNGGIRFIDFRIDFTHTAEFAGIGNDLNRKDDWFVMHGTQTKHPAIYHLAQIKAFLDRNPDEIVIIMCTRRGSVYDSDGKTLLTGSKAFPGATMEDKYKFWKQVNDLFGELMFDHSKGSLSDTPIRKILERNQRVVWYSIDYAEFTGNSIHALDAAAIDMTTARPYPGGNMARGKGQRDVFGNKLRRDHHGENTIRVFSMAAVADDLMAEILTARKLGFYLGDIKKPGKVPGCAYKWEIPGMDHREWCPLTLQDAAMLVNYYNQESLEYAYQDPDKNFPHVCHIDMIAPGGQMRVGTRKMNPLGDVGEFNDEGNEESVKNREAAYPFSATLVGKNIQRLCKNGKNSAPCSKLKSIVEKERGTDPVKAWDDHLRGRHKCFSDVYPWDIQFGEKPCNPNTKYVEPNEPGREAPTLKT